MAPDSQPPKRRLPSKKGPLAPHLEFLREFAKPFPEDAAECIAHLRRLLTLVQQHRIEILESGWDADAILAEMEPLMANLEASQAKVEIITEKLLQATADSADANRNVFRALETIIQEASEENPFHPAVEEGKELLEEWRKHMPTE